MDALGDLIGSYIHQIADETETTGFQRPASKIVDQFSGIGQEQGIVPQIGGILNLGGKCFSIIDGLSKDSDPEVLLCPGVFLEIDIIGD